MASASVGSGKIGNINFAWSAVKLTLMVFIPFLSVLTFHLRHFVLSNCLCMVSLGWQYSYIFRHKLVIVAEMVKNKIVTYFANHLFIQ